MIVYRLRYKTEKDWSWRTDDQNAYFQKNKMSKNTGVIYLTVEAARRAKRGIDHPDYYPEGEREVVEIVAFNMTEKVEPEMVVTSSDYFMRG